MAATKSDRRTDILCIQGGYYDTGARNEFTVEGFDPFRKTADLDL